MKVPSNSSRSELLKPILDLEWLTNVTSSCPESWMHPTLLGCLVIKKERLWLRQALGRLGDPTQVEQYAYASMQSTLEQKGFFSSPDKLLKLTADAVTQGEIALPTSPPTRLKFDHS